MTGYVLKTGHTVAPSAVAPAITGPISRGRIASAKESVLKDDFVLCFLRKGSDYLDDYKDNKTYEKKP